jgi:surfeit locus 1 family protein
MTPRIFFSRKWRFATVLVVIGMIFLAQLGFWQLDRRDQRLAENDRLIAQLEQNPLILDGTVQWDDPVVLDDRKAQVSGRFDYANQVAIKNAEWFGAPGMDLVTPLLIDGSDKAILVNRGWIPVAQAEPADWPQFDEAEQAQVIGYIQKAEVRPDGAAIPPAAGQPQWFRVDIEGIQNQMPYEILPFYLMWQPDGAAAAQSVLPYRHVVEFDLSEGSHLSYAIQWFLFAAMFGVGYVFYVRRDLLDSQRRPEDGAM